MTIFSFRNCFVQIVLTLSTFERISFLKKLFFFSYYNVYFSFIVRNFVVYVLLCCRSVNPRYVEPTSSTYLLCFVRLIELNHQFIMFVWLCCIYLSPDKIHLSIERTYDFIRFF